jgi:hypothetical protein
MPLSEQALAHRLRVLRHQEKLAAEAETEKPAELTGPQMTLPLVGEVRRETGLRSAGRKRTPDIAGRQLGYEVSESGAARSAS